MQLRLVFEAFRNLVEQATRSQFAQSRFSRFFANEIGGNKQHPFKYGKPFVAGFCGSTHIRHLFSSLCARS